MKAPLCPKLTPRSMIANLFILPLRVSQAWAVCNAFWLSFEMIKQREEFSIVLQIFAMIHRLLQ